MAAQEINSDNKKFTASALADLNGDGAADLVLGTVNETVNGVGLFERRRRGGSIRRMLRSFTAPLPTASNAVRRRVIDPVVDIQPIKLDAGQSYWDLIVVSTDAYMGNAVQFLKNDGAGHFTDVSSDVIDGPEEVFFNSIGKPFTWMYRAMVFESRRGLDIITKSESRVAVPSYVLGTLVMARMRCWIR